MEQIKEKEMVPYVGDFCPVLPEEKDWSDIKVEFINKPFDTSKVIMNNENFTIPTTGTAGYVRIEKPYNNEQLKPRLFEVDKHRFEVIC